MHATYDPAVDAMYIYLFGTPPKGEPSRARHAQAYRSTTLVTHRLALRFWMRAHALRPLR